MNILVIPTWYPNGINDKLMGIYHQEFCEALANNKMNVNMLYLDRQGLSLIFSYLFNKKNAVIKENNYKTYITKILDISRISFNLQINYYTKKLDKAFKKYLKNNPKPDVIHAMVTIPAGYAACKLGKKYNIPVVVTEHASYFERFFKNKYKKYGDYVLENSYFTTVSKYMTEKIKELGFSSTVLPNLVNVDLFNIPRKKINGLRLVAVVALRKDKRIEDIIASLKIIIKTIKDATLTVVGDGPDENYFKAKCHELKMDKYVTFVGRKNKEEIAKILNESNIYVVASGIETFGIPIIEAFAAGIPVVSTKCGGPEELIDNTTGKLVSIGNIKEMANAIIDVYHNIDNYKASYLRKIAGKYSSKNVSNTAIEIYKSLKK